MPEISIKDGIVTGSLPRRALNLVYSWLDEHRDELLENWERLAKGEKAQNFSPLIKKFPLYKGIEPTEKFKDFTVTDWTVSWGNGEIDIAPEYLYENGVPA